MCTAALTTDGGAVIGCRPSEGLGPITGTRLQTVAEMTPIGYDHWAVLVAADRGSVTAASCGGRALQVTPAGTDTLPSGVRRYYLVQSPWELAGKPVAQVLSDAGTETSTPLDVRAEPIGHGMPGQVCTAAS